MDACLSYLYKAALLLEDYTEIPPYEAVFEATDENVAAAISKNAEIENKTLTLMQKAIAAVKSIFNRIREILSSIGKWMHADKDELNSLKEFQRKLKENPELANKKVTLDDFRAINDEYNKVIGGYEKQYRGLKDEDLENRPNFLKDIKTGIDGVITKATSIGKTATASFTIEAAINYAKQNSENAATVQRFIDNDIFILSALEKELGKSEIRKFKKKIKHLNSRIAIVRMFARGREEQSKGLRGTVEETLKSIRGVLGRASRSNKDLRDLERSVAWNVAGIAKDATLYAKGVAKENRKLAKEAEEKLLRDNQKYLSKKEARRMDEYTANKVADERARAHATKEQIDDVFGKLERQVEKDQKEKARKERREAKKKKKNGDE